jgi:tyrosyl-tRNA synthetase
MLTFLFADVHAFLDNLKAPIELVNARADYYRHIITAVFRSLNLPVDRLTFVVGSSYQYGAKYNLDKYKLTSITSEHDARKAGAEVVKQVSSPLLSGLLYPLLQALDEEYLGVDFQFGGVDQRKIFTYAEQYLPKIGYTKRSHLMNTMVPGLSGGKMSSSDPNSKIDFLDGPAAVKSKIQKAVCAPGEVEGNGVLAFVKSVIIPIGELFRGQGRSAARVWVHADAPVDAVFTVVGNPKFGGSTVHYVSSADLEDAYAKGDVHPGDLKTAVTDAINALLAPIQAEFKASKEFQDAEARAYPPEVKAAPKKKEKKYTPKPEHLMTPEEKAAQAVRDKEFAEKAAKKGGLNEVEKLKEAVIDTLSGQ